jgi:hypothetical protein
MPDAKKYILLVEGESDRGFFEQFCKKLQLNDVGVTIATPKDGGLWRKNGNQGVLNVINIYLTQLQDGTIERFAVIVDAEYKDQHALGCQGTIERFTSNVAQHGFEPDHSRCSPSDGLVFAHNDGLANIGLWVMPNNSDEGMLEDWMRCCIHPDERALFDHVETTLSGLPEPLTKFKPIHRGRAEIATWLAWQKKAEYGLFPAAKEDSLLDANSSLFQSLAGWLKHIYT